jgi:NAD(P)-dependent dehydrogenase (short-subunit alcohol dehydrogenase family)
MPSLAAVRASNAAFSPPYIPVALFVGGTSGIGQGITEAFARLVKGNAHIVVIGRNREAAESIISQLPKPTSESNVTHEFVQCDVSLMKNVHATTKDLLTRLQKINFLVMSPGYMTTKGRDETEEGIDKKLAVHYYARWKFISDLLPALKKAKESGEDAKVLSVLAAGKGGEIDLNDLGLKKTFTLTNAALQGPTYNDLMMEVSGRLFQFFPSKQRMFNSSPVQQEFASQNPDLSFIHAYPGFVHTAIMSSSDSTILRLASLALGPLLYPFSTSYGESGEYMLHGLLNASKGAFRVGSRGEDIGTKRYFGSTESRKKLWEHTINETRV